MSSKIKEAVTRTKEIGPKRLAAYGGLILALAGISYGVHELGMWANRPSRADQELAQPGSANTNALELAKKTAERGNIH